MSHINRIMESDKIAEELLECEKLFLFWSLFCCWEVDCQDYEIESFVQRNYGFQSMKLRNTITMYLLEMFACD